MVVVATIGNTIGSLIAYAIGAWGGRPFLERWGRYILIRPHEIEAADRFFVKWGKPTVFVGRLLPVVRTFIAFPAGVARMNRVKFHAYTFAGSLPWCLGLAYVGQKLGQELLKEPWPLKHFMHRFDAVIASVILLGAAYFVYSRVKTLRAYREADKAKA